MKYTLLLLLLTGLILLDGSTPGRTDPMSSPSLHAYSVKGIVEAIAPDHHQVTVLHDDIPGYMKSMTMDFPVKDPSELKGISVGDKIKFSLVVGTSEQHIQNIHRIGHGDPTKPTVSATPSVSMPMTMPMPNSSSK